MTNSRDSCPFGSHRADGSLPQPAERIDPALPIRSNELLIAVEALNLDSSSMRQIADSCGGDETRIRARIAEIVTTRGKMHNPVTGSGGVLVGSVAEIGADFPTRGLARGDRVCTLVSLSLTPLGLTRIGRVNTATAQIEATGHAILFESGLWAKMPPDIPDSIALALFDVAGAPGTVVKSVRPGDTVFVLGTGKAGLLSLYAARRALGATGRLIGADASAAVVAEVGALGVADEVLHLDLRDPVATYEAVRAATGERLADLTVNTTNVTGTEGATILATRDGGRAFFFSMATSFTAAALTAEGVGRDIEMLIGNGYTAGWTDTALDLYRRNPTLAALLRAKLGG
jgi:L-erythro-3,5-diaminohexanoate dehydrogenase